MKCYVFAAALVSLTSSPVWADSAPNLIQPAQAPGKLQLGGKQIAYVASWREIPLNDEQGHPSATISTTSYVRKGAQAETQRPVLFAFNGGPGAASAALNFGLLGPLRRIDAGGARQVLGSDGTGLANNAESVLDVTDIVLIDPVGTGFSRELHPGGGKPWWGMDGDLKATEIAIRTWLKDNGRETSPVYILGESYGGFRAAGISYKLADLNLAGVILVSPGIDLSKSSDLASVADLPAMTVTAAAHGKVDARGRDSQAIYNEARDFAQGEYATALMKGSLLPVDERDRLAARVAGLIGLPAAKIAAANLRVGSQDFLEQLQPGMIVGRIDTRVTAPVPKEEAVPGRIAAANDPALNMGASNVKKSPATAAYLRSLGVKTDRDYVSITLDVNFGWNWQWTAPSGLVEDNIRVNSGPNLGELLKKKANVRVLLLGGLYDLATPWYGQQYDLTHSGVPADRLTMVGFPSGHAIYGDDATRLATSKILHSFITTPK